MPKENHGLHKKHQVITWISTDEEMPDADTAVLIRTPDSDERVWIGWFDGERWMMEAGPAGRVTHWSDIPQGPEVSNAA